MNIEIVRRLSLARHLFELGMASLHSKNDLHLFAAVNLMQDAVEAFLIAVAEFLAAPIDANTKFDKYFVAIDDKIKPKELPFKPTLLRLNRIRVDSKHYGIQPARDECARVAVSVREFFEETSRSLLGVSFTSISAIDLLDEGEPKTLLLEAKAALERGEHVACAVACRKALYLEVERNYDVSEYKDGKPKNFLSGYTLAPFYARNEEYIQKNVRDPTDYIVRDHSRIDQDLLTQGVDTTAFWNVWRLTPEVIRLKDKEWVVKYDFDKLDAAILADKVEYIYATSIDILLAIHANRKKTRTSEYGSYFLELTQENVPVFEKADKTSKVVGHTPAGLFKIDTDFRVSGLTDAGPYWSVHHFRKGLFLHGYIHDEHVKRG